MKETSIVFHPRSTEEVPQIGDRVMTCDGETGIVYGISKCADGLPIVMVNMGHHGHGHGARWFRPHQIAWRGERGKDSISMEDALDQLGIARKEFHAFIELLRQMAKG